MTLPLITIAIPTFERPLLLLHAVRSCLNQTYRGIEVLIGDDSRDGGSKLALGRLEADRRIRYVRNAERLGQNGNVNKLFALAQGTRLVLLHDDDLLLPEAIEVLDECWRDHPDLVASFGKYYLMTHSGRTLGEASAACNYRQHRSSQYAGFRDTGLWSVLSQQFPPDGFMVRTAAARATPFRSQELVGDYCDFDFAVRLATLGGFCFVDRHVSKYRLTARSVSTESETDGYSFSIARDLQVPHDLEGVRREYLQASLPPAVRRHLLRGERSAAWQLIWRSEYWRGGWQSRPRIVNLLQLILPTFVVRAVNSARRIAVRAARRSDVIYRLIAWTRTIKLGRQK